jgi:hypothetical protein
MSTAELKEVVASLAIAQQETGRRINQMAAAIERMSGSIGREWGHLVESLTEASCLKQMQAAGVEVSQTAEATKSERQGYEQEWDVLLVNGGELVAVEVKSRLRDGQIERIEEKLGNFKKAFPQYAGYKIYGAVAALKYDGHLDKVAERHGLFVFRPGGDIMNLINQPGFRPKEY